MKKEVIVRLHASFEELVQHDETGSEFWLARDLQELLGYARWENFAKVIDKAQVACKVSGHEAEDHFLDVTKMVDLGSGATRAIEDVALTRYACYLIAQNGDPSKDAIAFAQTYFALQTRKQELIEQRIAEAERLSARKKLTLSEKELSGIIYERVGDQMSFARIRSKGDVALFGGLTTQDMKNKLGVPESQLRRHGYRGLLPAADRAAALQEEAERHVREGLTEDELELFDLLKKDSMSQGETQRVKLAAKRMLKRLVEEHPKALVQVWFKDNQTQRQVRSEIERVLDEGLPETYERALFKQECDNVFDLVVDYASRGRKWAA